MKEILYEIDFNDEPDTFEMDVFETDTYEVDTFETDTFETDTFETDTLEAAQRSELESFLAVARAAHEERVHAFWRRFGLVYSDLEQ
jgi:hypothetical protein